MSLILAILTALFQFMPLAGPADAQAAGRELAEQAVYTIYTIPGGGTQSVLISIPLEDEQYLRLYSPPVLRAFTRSALALQQEKIPAGAEDVAFLLMNARHIAGETQLHLIGYVVTYLAGGAAGPLAGLHERFRVIDLNVDEDRVPPALIEFVGGLRWRSPFRVFD
ncbi:MAG: hypothetical protein LBB75_08525 [Oscillospiraceae bacterium]|jgi:hypothetical protein|nr:hypothetical protein [Oscillospiraceae bacterium]